MPTIDEVVERYLARHDCDPATTTKLKRQLKHAQGAFATRPVDLLEPFELSEWRMTLSDGVRHDVFCALRQVLEQARRWGWLKANPAAVVKNPKPKRGEIRIFPAWADVDAIVDELPTVYKPLPVFIVGTGVRPEELVALERRDVDFAHRAVTVERVYTQGHLKKTPKTSRSRRRIPLRARVINLLEQLAPRIDSPLLFSAARGGYINFEHFRERHWRPAFSAAGVDYVPPYSCRHTCASWALQAGISTLALARRMGTSLVQIDETYGHLAVGSDQWEVALLDAYDERVDGALDPFGRVLDASELIEQPNPAP